MTTAVEALETLELGAPYAEPYRQADAEVSALRDSATERLAPSVMLPLEAGALAAFALDSELWPRSSWGRCALDMLARAADTWPELVRVILRRETLERIGFFAAANASADMQVRAAEEARSAFLLGAARLLTEHATYGQAARDLLLSEEMRGRIEAARERHEQHTRAELERAERERQAAERARAEEAGRAVIEAARNAERLRGEAQQAGERARRLAAEHLERRLRASHKESVRTGREIFSTADLIANCSGMSLEQIARIEEALEVERSVA